MEALIAKTHLWQNVPKCFFCLIIQRIMVVKNGNILFSFLGERIVSLKFLLKGEVSKYCLFSWSFVRHAKKGWIIKKPNTLIGSCMKTLQLKGWGMAFFIQHHAHTHIHTHPHTSTHTPAHSFFTYILSPCLSPLTDILSHSFSLCTHTWTFKHEDTLSKILLFTDYHTKVLVK